MNAALEVFRKLRTLFLVVAETGLALVALIVVVYMLLGEESGTFVISVMANISLVVDAITPQAFIAIAVTFALIGVMTKRL